MSSPEPARRTEGAATRAAFATTQWTMVLDAGGSDSTQARMALEDLCRAYWRPLYAFVRRLGRGPHDAQDLTQEFFARLLAGSSLERVDPARGRFRSFLLTAMKHFLANEWDRLRALKRGGGVTIVPLDAAETDQDGNAVANGMAVPVPELAFERQWALAVLDRVLARLEDEHGSAGKLEQFRQLRETLTADRASLPYAVIGDRLGLSEGAVKVAVHRLRQRFRELLRVEVANTVADPAQVDDELRHLFTALAGT